MLTVVPAPNAQLKFKAPALVLRRVHRTVWHVHAGGREVRNRRLNLGERLALAERAQKSRVGSGCIFEQTGRLVGSQVSPNNSKGIHERRVTGKGCRQAAWQGVMKSQIPRVSTVLCETPIGCHAKLNRGDHRILIGVLESLPLVDQDSLIVRLIGIVAYGCKRPAHPGEAAALAHWVGLMFRTEGECQCKVRKRVPLVLAVKCKIIEGNPLSGLGGQRIDLKTV